MVSATAEAQICCHPTVDLADSTPTPNRQICELEAETNRNRCRTFWPGPRHIASTVPIFIIAFVPMLFIPSKGYRSLPKSRIRQQKDGFTNREKGRFGF